jgi:hypothetical protein
MGKNSTYETLVVSRYVLGHTKFKGKKKESNIKKEEEISLIRRKKSKGLTYMRYQVRAAENLSVASLGNDG